MGSDRKIYVRCEIEDVTQLTAFLQVILGLGFPLPEHLSMTSAPFLVVTTPSTGIACTAGGTNTSTWKQM